MTTYRQLPLSRLGHLIPPLVDGQALVALLTTTADLPWAAKAAWDIARIAAREGRRGALVDLHLEQPAHERWRKLQAGFRSEGALLLAFLSEAGLAQLAAMPDGMIVLAPAGLTETFVNARDIPLLGVVRDRWLPSTGSPPPSAKPPSPPRRRGVRAALVALLIAALAVGGWALLAGARESFIAPPAPPPPLRPLAAPPRVAPEKPVRPPAQPRADTLGWTVQLAAYATLDKALAHADRLAADDGLAALVTPVPQSNGGKGPVWYRVLAGSYATRPAAAAARAKMWRRGIVAEGIGDLLLAPYSYHVPTGSSLDSLRRRGLPAVRWSNGNILLGAFEAPEQAAFTQAALTRAHVRANLLPRMGRGTP